MEGQLDEMTQCYNQEYSNQLAMYLMRKPIAMQQPLNDPILILIYMVCRFNQHITKAPLVIQLLTRVRKDVGHSYDLLLCQLPVSIFDGISYAREVLGVVAIPSLRSKYDMLELFSSRKLYIMSVL